MRPIDVQTETQPIRSRVFISYRRSDAQGWAGHLGESLSRAFGETPLFFDLTSIAPGEDFVAAIMRAINAEGVVIALIGPTWLTTAHPDGGRRLDDPDDVVRQELETALAVGVRVIPVLVGGASVPPVANLPSSLRALAHRNALELTDARWEYDVERLTAAIESAAGLERQPTPAPETRPPDLDIQVGVNAHFDGVEAGDVTGLRSAGPFAADGTPRRIDVLGGARVGNGSKLGDITGVSIGREPTD